MLPDHEVREMTQSDYGLNKADKSKELNSSMTIQDGAQDEYTSKIRNIGGQ